VLEGGLLLGHWGRGGEGRSETLVVLYHEDDEKDFGWVRKIGFLMPHLLPP
jgi:hypothetical protein